MERMIKMLRNSSSTNKINELVFTGLLMCLVTVATMFFRIPIPFTQGYVHLGDSMIFLSILILGRRNGTIAAGVGSALGDILGGYAFWAPWTLVIKGLMAFIMGTFIEAMEKRGKISPEKAVSAMEIVAMVLAGMEMVAGYYVASGFMYGNWTVGILSIPWNVGQFVVGMIIAVVLSHALSKTPVKKYFTAKSK